MSTKLPLTEPNFIARLAAHSDSAVVRLYTIYGPFIRGVLAENGVRREDLDDEWHDVILSILHSLQSAETIKTFRAWLYRAVRNRAIDYLRRRQRRKYATSNSDALAHLPKSTDEPEEYLALAADPDRMELLLRTLQQRLSEIEWTILNGILHDIPQKDIAQQLGLSTARISQIKQRILLPAFEEEALKLLA